MVQAVLRTVRGGHHNAVDLVGADIQIKTVDLHLVIGMTAVRNQLYGCAVHGRFGGLDLAELPAAGEHIIPCCCVVSRSLTQLVVSVAVVLEQSIHTGVSGRGILAAQLDGDVITGVIGDLLRAVQRPRGQHLDRERNAGNVRAVAVDVIGAICQISGTGLGLGGAGHSVYFVLYASRFVELCVGDVHDNIGGGNAVFFFRSFHILCGKGRNRYGTHHHGSSQNTRKCLFQSHGNTPHQMKFLR